MKIIEINSMKNGSTGNIVKNIADIARLQGHIVYTACSGNLTQRKTSTENPQYHIYIGGILGSKLHNGLSKIWGQNGTYSHLATYLFLKKIDKIKPDIIHIHNLHCSYIHIGMLFDHIKKHNIKVVWTLHDCWSFTGHCPYFDMANCEKWKRRCNKCPQFKGYPRSHIDDSKKMYEKKRKWFCGVEKMAIVTPSIWLKDLVQKSFLNEYPVQVIYNGIDLDIFKPTPSDFREKNHLVGKKIILGVSFAWGERKGLDIFSKMAYILDESYQIVLVGVEKNLRERLPSNILCIESTDNLEKMAKIYSAADVFFNPTREEVLGLVNIEALACGTPVVAFHTGGVPECIQDGKGILVPKDDLEESIRSILWILDHLDEFRKCSDSIKKFDKRKKAMEYMDLYYAIDKKEDK